MPYKGPAVQTNEHFVDARQLAMKGLNTLTDVHEIQEQETPDMSNTTFDAGVIGVRPGISLFTTKPSGETNTFNTGIGVQTADGTQYLIVSYGANWYLWDTTNNYWVPLNSSFTNGTLPFSYQGWINSIADSRMYIGNGVDINERWRASVGHSLGNINAINTTVTLQANNGQRFYNDFYSITPGSISSNELTILPDTAGNVSLPLGQMVFYTSNSIPPTGMTVNTIYWVVPQDGTTGTTFKLATSLANAMANITISISGSVAVGDILDVVEPIIISDGVNTATNYYYEVSNDTLHLVNQVGMTFGAGATVATTLTPRPIIPIGSIFTVSQRRFFTAAGTASTANTFVNQIGPVSPVTMNFSRAGEPEDYLNDPDDIGSGFYATFPDGYPAITHVTDFGEYLLVGKNQAEYRFGFIQNSDLSAQILQVTPIISGSQMGALSSQTTIKAMNSVYYPTLGSGVVQLAPISTGVTATSGITVVSFNITNYVNTLTFVKGRYFNQKLFWKVETSTEPALLIYDMIRTAWTKWDGMNPADMFVYNNLFYYAETSTGNILQFFSNTYNDNGNPIVSYFFTKARNFGMASMPKTADKVYLEGYMTSGTTLYADVWYNEKGELSKKTYKLNTSNPNFYFSRVPVDPLGAIPFNQGILDSMPPSYLATLGSFRCYLSIPNSYGYFVIQVKYYSMDQDAVWFITGDGINAQPEPLAPALLTIDDISVTQPIL